LMLRSTVVGERRVARASVRSLARSLGVAKDTAARAIRRLRVAGVVIGAQQRTASGVFDTGVYVISVPSEVLTVRTTTAKPRHAAMRSGESQLPLAL
jgi:DNA-binding transcriptional MocR family regulator